MFTGIIEEIGLIREVSPYLNGRELRIDATRVLQDTALGDSIAIDGVCLTVSRLYEEGFGVQCVASTLERTTLGGYEAGRRVNLERAMALGDRLGGHLVQGHVDGVGTVRSITPVGEMVLIDFDMPEVVDAVTVLHGSITFNGISLTINDLPVAGVAGVSIIPFTWEHTAISALRPGDPVNLEGDLIGRYVRRLLGRPGRTPEERSADLLRGWGY